MYESFRAVFVVTVLLCSSCLDRDRPATPGFDMVAEDALACLECKSDDAKGYVDGFEVFHSDLWPGDAIEVHDTPDATAEVVDADAADPDMELPPDLLDAINDGADGEMTDLPDDGSVDACLANCEGIDCGDDGCGGTCGECSGKQEACVLGGCTCIPDCAGKQCGDDGCGDDCGKCKGDQDVCVGNECLCQPACDGKTCGNDGCGGKCGVECDDGLDCTDDVCFKGECISGFKPLFCVIEETCIPAGFKNPENPCEACLPDKSTSAWSYLDSGTPCGAENTCFQGQCCDPEAGCAGKECGGDGCGGSCGQCPGDNDKCLEGECFCAQACDGLECGDNGCGGLCGICTGTQESCQDGVCICEPLCDGHMCGPDGCGGSCGTCDDGKSCTIDSCNQGQCDHQVQDFFCLIDDICVPSGAEQPGNECGKCQPTVDKQAWSLLPNNTPCGIGGTCFSGLCCNPTIGCDGIECGDDGCGGSCGNCGGTQDACVDGFCECQPQCVGKGCGGDGCGGSCGSCLDGKVCVNYECLCQPEHHSDCCGDDVCWFDSCGVQDGTVAECSFGCEDGGCANCVPQCLNKACGPDSCGGDCGTCTGLQEQCLAGACVCVPDCDTSVCGDDGCGGSCGTCAGAQEACVDGLCICQPVCTDKQCGPDGCGENCGQCLGLQDACEDGACVCQPACSEKECGPDGCSGVCGGCNDDLDCTLDTCLDGVCSFQLFDDFCIIAGQCVASQEANPDDLCQQCRPLTASDAWSEADDGDSCGQDLVCFQGSCCDPAANCQGLACGDDSCGDSCGTCQGLQEACVNGDCVCFPECEGTLCGDDGCAGSCGTCQGQDICLAGACVCQPDCVGKSCGDDGCGGSCGTCPGSQEQCVLNSCVCQSDCVGKECGPDGCGSNCAACTGGKVCSNFLCLCEPHHSGGCCADGVDICWFDSCGNQEEVASNCEFGCTNGACENCEPDCAGKSCGGDGCGGSCGSCTGQDVCTSGACVCQPACTGKVCGPDGCGANCGSCTGAQEACVDGACVCQPACTGKNCGSDGCSGICGTCSGQDACTDGVCVCQPACSGKVCGPDGCTGDCGTCSGGQEVCNAGLCVCQPDCVGKVCGTDGCSGDCGTCTGAQELCVGGACICQPDCTGKSCGSDGCGGSCGSCDDQLDCTVDACIQGSCVNSIDSNYCVIDGVCATADGLNPANACESCQPTSSQNSWLPLLDGASCGAGKVCYLGVCCDQAANCAGFECGDDGCGGTCGTCSGGLACAGGTCADPAACNDGNSVDWDGCTDGQITEFRVNSTTSQDQSLPAAATFADGGFAVAWQSKDQDGDAEGIYAQLYNSSGSVTKSEFLVNATTSKEQSRPVLATLSGGNLVAVWQSLDQDGSDYGVYGRVFDQAGTAVTGEFAVNSYTDSAQQLPSVAPLSGGGFAVAFSGKGSGDSTGVFLRLFNANGTPKYGQVLLNTQTTDLQERATVAGDNDAGSVAWQSKDQDGSGYGIYAQDFTNTGGKAGSEFGVSSTSDNDQWLPTAAPYKNGGSVFAWSGKGTGDVSGIFAQRFKGNGKTEGTEFRLNSTTANEQSWPCITRFSDILLLAAWQSMGQDGNSYGIIARRFDGATALADEVGANVYAAGEQTQPACATFGDGTYIIVWQSNNQDGSGYGIYAQRFNSDDSRKLK